MKKTQTIFLLFFLIVAACSNPIDQAKQNELIEYNQIRIGMNCANLTDMLGGYRAITYLYLEKKDGEDGLKAIGRYHDYQEKGI